MRIISKYLFAACLAWLLLPGMILAQGDMPANVKVALVKMQSLAPVTLVPGTVISRNDAKLAAEVEGRLITVVDVGTFAATGTMVAEIEDTTLRLRRDELRAEIDRAEARLRFLESEEQRFAMLAESNLAAATQLEQTRSDRDVARGDLAVARSRLAQNQDLLNRTRIAAPFDGIVVERLMTPGERVSDGSIVVRLVDQEHLEVVARAPLEYYSYVKRGALLDLRAGRQTAFGTVRTVVAVGDENTHQFEIRMDLDGAPFPVGQTLRVAVPQDDLREVLAVPRDALVIRAQGQSVFIVDANNRAQQVRVTTGVGSGDHIEVLGAVSPGDKVIIRGNERLQPGQSVAIMDS